MDTRFRTSFIPKQEVAALSNRGGSNFRYSILSIIAVVLFAASVISAATVFLYQRSLVKVLNQMNSELVAAKASFDPSLIAELVKLDKRIESAKELLDRHWTVSPIFSILEKETLQGVRFRSLTYELDAKGQPNISLEGEAVNFSSVALQADTFGVSSKIKNPIFSGLNFDEKGTASFNFQGTLDGDSLLYKKVLFPSDTSSSGAGNGVKVYSEN